VRSSIVISLLAATTVAHAATEPARDDIVDIRHGRMPDRAAALGWTDGGAFVFRRIVCSVQDDYYWNTFHVDVVAMPIATP
jgi:hypothetical protein